MSQDKILVVDNEIDIIQLLRLYLSREGFEVIWTTEPQKALSIVQENEPDLVLLDIVMPQLSGIEVCRQIRDVSEVPILFISCKDQDTDKVLGFTMGGDDYITKPFSRIELIARVKSHLRRKYTQQLKEPSLSARNQISFDPLRIDLNGRTVTINNIELKLTAKEFDLLVLLTKYPNRVFTPSQIFNHLWDTYGLEEDLRTVGVHISNLRKKLEPVPSDIKFIKTVRGIGYKFVPPNGSHF
ncbi:response regulator transcription factor [Anaerotignum sp.]|uniref:response regulator transcription factor n=1 Tax=Anaerotignum sp. TaxID=2039241 RepID=UPI0028A82E52|nr:response regulator transcription factor [Anaerotignum sp.]